MSHLTTIKVQIKDGKILANILNQLGHNVSVNAQIRGDRGEQINAEYVINLNGCEIGFRKDGGDNYELIADWYAGVDRTQFVNEIQRKYAHQMLLQTAENQGYTIEAEEVLEDGSVRVVVGRWI
ncbi:DUF1257 domain-containing protein [Chamaesiphon sp. VAR_48_metabat_403]|uniref:DUF1257 domain-containing protein n=1 Tax=Chamaesiphon sp. VAR_48_metabat_403 TaxID=2964700 RepID=UPI00286D7726|nr:DUF1257 domain-containing protein [Chamaesiphon sp. VAR_48_metabat_403]